MDLNVAKMKKSWADVRKDLKGQVSRAWKRHKCCQRIQYKTAKMKGRANAHMLRNRKAKAETRCPFCSPLMHSRFFFPNQLYCRLSNEYSFPVSHGHYHVPFPLWGHVLRRVPVACCSAFSVPITHDVVHNLVFTILVPFIPLFLLVPVLPGGITTFQASHPFLLSWARPCLALLSKIVIACPFCSLPSFPLRSLRRLRRRLAIAQTVPDHDVTRFRNFNWRHGSTWANNASAKDAIHRASPCPAIGGQTNHWPKE